MGHRIEYNILLILIEVRGEMVLKEDEDENKEEDNKGIRGKSGRGGKREKEGKEEG